MGRYSPTTWVNDTTPALNAANLNKLEQGVRSAFDPILGGIIMLGHSWAMGLGHPVIESQRTDIGGRLASLLGCNDDNLLQFATSGAALTGGSNSSTLDGIKHSSWGTVLQAVLPPASTQFGGTNIQGATPDRASVFLWHINDPFMDSNFWLTHGLNAWGHALRTCISRCSASFVYASTHSSVAKTTGFATTVTSNTQNTGPSYIRSTANGDKITITLPSDFPGGTVAVCFIGTQNGGATLSGAHNNSTTTITLNASPKLPASGNYVLLVDSEQMLVTAGQGTTSLTVTRGVNGTTAASHSNGASAGVASTTYGVDFTGTVANSTGTLKLAGQGYAQTPVSCVKRIVCTAADAGKTIICTVSGIVASDTGAQINFDSWWLEAPIAPPVMVCNTPRYLYAGVLWGVNSIAVNPTFTTSQNFSTASVCGEFGANVQVVDIDALFYATTGTLAANINNSVTSITVNAQGTSFPPAAGFTLRMDTEDMFVSAVSGSSSPYTLTVTRGYNGSTAASHTAGAWVADRSFMATDNVHPNTYGSARIARAIYDKMIATLLAINDNVLSISSSAWNRKRNTPHIGLSDGYWVTPPSLVRSGSLGSGTLAAHPIYIPERCIVTEMGFYLVTGQATTSYRLGIFVGAAATAKPELLVADFGTVATTGAAGWTSITGLWQMLEPGWYWLGAARQGAGGTDPTVQTLVALTAYQVPWVSNPGDFAAATAAITGTSGNVSGGFTGYYDSSASYTGALTGFGTPALPLFGATIIPRLAIKVRAHHFS